MRWRSLSRHEITRQRELLRAGHRPARPSSEMQIQGKLDFSLRRASRGDHAGGARAGGGVVIRLREDRVIAGRLLACTPLRSITIIHTEAQMCHPGVAGDLLRRADGQLQD